MNLITDIDSTINDHPKRIRRNTLPSWPGTSIHPRAFTREEIMQDQPLPHGLEVLWVLEKSGTHVSYLSARGFREAKEITRTWLRLHTFPNPGDFTLVDTLADKLAALRELKPDYYVDDFTTGQEHAIPTFHKEVAEQIQALGIRVIVFRGDWLDVLEQIKLYDERRS